MTSVEREGFKDQLRAMIAGRGDGIDLDTPNRWVIEGVKDPGQFFRQIGVLIPADANLYFEGGAIDSKAAELYKAHRATNAVGVARDTIYPVPEVYHVAFSHQFLEALLELIERLGTEKCFHHVKAYLGERLLFAFHDAFDGSDLIAAEHLPEERIVAFARTLGVKSYREPHVNKRDPEVLRRILWAMDNPQTLRINWPWWKKALFFWKR